MYVAKVIGSIWATKKFETLHGQKLLIIQPLNADLDKTGEPIIAVDTAGAGAGEYVLYVTASEAVIPMTVDFAPVDASIVGVIDSIYKE
ncbi:MAG: EutN/CcmL family microcompartment protein [Ignavibacteriales bacterium]|nr:EutN/CcmL family microcompartment protein [Ignavibacteriales bacterium]